MLTNHNIQPRYLHLGFLSKQIKRSLKSLRLTRLSPSTVFHLLTRTSQVKSVNSGGWRTFKLITLPNSKVIRLNEAKILPRKNFATLWSCNFACLRCVTFEFGSFTDIKVLFPVVSTDFEKKSLKDRLKIAYVISRQMHPSRPKKEDY